MKIIKRDGHIVDYEPDKIRVAIEKDSLGRVHISTLSIMKG